MKVTIVIGTFGTVTKRLLKGLEDLEAGSRVKTILPTKHKMITSILKERIVKYIEFKSIFSLEQKECKKSHMAAKINSL